MKISVVMPSFNQAPFVEAALQSVLAHDYQDIEILFVDGGSTDGTMEIVERYRHRLAYCVSEPDKGQSDALRKGFDRSTGDVLTWLNTDDILLPGALREVASLLASSPRLSWVLGNVVWIDAEDRILRCWRGEGLASPRLGMLAAGGPSSFFARDLYFRVGGVDRDFHYAMDTHLWWRFAMAGACSRRMRGYAWALRLHEDAKVSGHAFAAAGDETQLNVVRRRREEAVRIREMTADYVIGLPAPVAKLATAARRLMSPVWLRGQFDHIAWRGRRLGEMKEALCRNLP